MFDKITAPGTIGASEATLGAFPVQSCMPNRGTHAAYAIQTTLKHAIAAGALHLARVLYGRAVQLPLLQHLGWLAASFRLPRPGGRA